MGYIGEIKMLIDERIEYYKSNPKEITRDFTIERSVQEEYDGRQLLEMLQNVDDTGSSKVRIAWDSKTKKLAISNYGEAFSIEGIESLMRSHSSPKRKEDFIGNKGLGFRSLLSWAHTIDIYANNCRIRFSQDNAALVFNNLLSLTTEQKAAFRKQCNVSNNVAVFPALAIPELLEFTRQDDWQTVIEVNYLEDTIGEKIQAIIEEISNELLLFLRNIQEIELVVNDVTTTFKSKKTEYQDWDEIHINEKTWRVFTQKGVLPEALQDFENRTNKKYMLKIAFQNDLSDTYHKLFNFFPTKISVALPCIIHGTFDLNTSRDYINPTDTNKFIFKQLAKFLGQCSVLLSNEEVSWKPFQLVNPINLSSDSSLVNELYDDLRKISHSERIIPTINSDYTDFKNAKYYNNTFNTFFRDNFPNILTELILPIENIDTVNFRINHYEDDILVHKLNALSHTAITIEQRAELIYQLIKCGRHRNKDERFSLLINEKNSAVISKNTVAFTPMVQSQVEFSIPDSVEIDFINTTLYNVLSKKLEDQFDAKNQVSREFQSAVKEVVNVQPYDSNSIIIRIVNGINRKLEKPTSVNDHHDLIKEMVSSLFANFQHLKTQLDTLDIEISLINKNNEIVKSSSLFMGVTYPDGDIVEWLYKDIYTDANYLIELNRWGLTNINPDEVERFFIWLGVNKFAKIGVKKLNGNWEEQHYFNYLFGVNSPNKPVNFQLDRINKDTFVSYIENMNDVLKMDITKKLFLILKDERIKNKIEELESKLFWRYVQTSYTLATSISYIKYQYLKENIFNSYVLEDGNESLQELINQETIIDFSLLREKGYTFPEVATILVKLGAKQSVEFLEPSVLYGALLKIPQLYLEKNTRGVQGIYKKILDALEYQDSKKKILQRDIPVNLELFAKKEGKTVLLPAKEVYYSNNSVLPKKIERTIPIFDFPKRGGQEKVNQFLEVQILDTSQIKLHNVDEALLLQSSFNKLFESLKVPILLYRLYSKSLQKELLTKEAIRQNVSYLKNCNIILVYNCTYSYDDNEKVLLEDFEFVIFENVYYLKVQSNLKIEDLLPKSGFSDAFAEIMSIQFNVTELKNDFRFLIRNDLRDTLHLIEQDFDEEKINKVRRYFGISAQEQRFWQSIYTYKKIEFPLNITKQRDLIIQIKKDLELLIIDEYYKFDFDECTNVESFNFLSYLVNTLSLPLREIYQQGIGCFHFERLRNLRESKEESVKKTLWKYLNSNRDEQAKFLNYLDAFKQVHPQNFFTDQDRYSLHINYYEVFKNFVEKKLPIKLHDESLEDVQVINYYPNLLTTYTVELDELDDEIKSLFYFKGNEGVINSYLENNFRQSDNLNNEKDEAEDSKNMNQDTLSIIDTSLGRIGISMNKNGYSKNNRKQRRTHSRKLDEIKSIKGKEAEIEALKSYKKQYGENKVKWVSGYSTTPDSNDNLQYDITYEDKTGTWRHVEVKSISNSNSFILTQAEKEHGIQNNSIYEFALVTENGIHRIASPFNFDIEDTFENNKFFSVETKDYQLYFKLLANE